MTGHTSDRGPTPDRAILLVDDEKAVLDALRSQLRSRFTNQFLYETAESADEAWELIDELTAEGVELLVIVSDWLMPGIRGDEFLIQLHERFPRVIKVMLTGQADEAAIARATRLASLHRCLSKPWTEDDLIDTILTGIAQR